MDREVNWENRFEGNIYIYFKNFGKVPQNRSDANPIAFLR